MRHNKRRLGFETLENRNLMAGNVTATMTHGLLTITDDGSDNHIVLKGVHSNLPGNAWELSGLQNTTINGEHVHPIFHLTMMVMQLTGGHDSVHFTSGAIANGLTIIGSASEAMKLDIDNLATGPMHISAIGSFDQVIRINNVQSLDKIAVSTGNGNDTVALEGGLTKGRLFISTGDGSDKVTLSHLQIMNWLGTLHCLVDTGAGNDHFHESFCFFNNALLEVNTGDGNDTADLSQLFGPAKIKMGSGDDRVTLKEDTFPELHVNGGGDLNDTLWLMDRPTIDKVKSQGFTTIHHHSG